MQYSLIEKNDTLVINRNGLVRWTLTIGDDLIYYMTISFLNHAAARKGLYTYMTIVNIVQASLTTRVNFFSDQTVLCEAEKAQLNLSQQLLTHNLEKWERKDFVAHVGLKNGKNSIQ